MSQTGCSCFCVKQGCGPGTCWLLCAARMQLLGCHVSLAESSCIGSLQVWHWRGTGDLSDPELEDPGEVLFMMAQLWHLPSPDQLLKALKAMQVQLSLEVCFWMPGVAGGTWRKVAAPPTAMQLWYVESDCGFLTGRHLGTRL